MMRTGRHDKGQDSDSAVTNLLEYITVSGVIMVLFVVILLLANNNIMEDPANRIIYVSFTDIGNGVSTRIIDVYSLAPREGAITSKFDIPDEILGRSYFVNIEGEANNQNVTVFRGDLKSRISLAGIGATENRGSAGGSTAGAGMNRITYCSTGNFGPSGDCIL